MQNKNTEIWDWTKLDSYACMLRGHYAMEEHLVPKEPQEALVFGIAFHKMIETWIQESLRKEIPSSSSGVVVGLDEHKANCMVKARRAFLDIWQRELSLQLQEKLELEGNRRSYLNACRLFEAYVRKFPLNMFNKIIAVEVPFTLYLGTTSRSLIEWSGVLDRIVEWQGGIYYIDIKTSSYSCDERFFSRFRYDGQMLGYAWAGEQLGYGNFAGIMIHGVEVKVPQIGLKLRKDGLPYSVQGRQAEELIQSDIITIYPNMLEEWRQKVLWKIDKIYEAREAGYWEPDMGDLCTQFNGCAFQRLCYSPDSLREIRKQEHYITKAWNPFDRDARQVVKPEPSKEV